MSARYFIGKPHRNVPKCFERKSEMASIGSAAISAPARHPLSCPPRIMVSAGHLIFDGTCRGRSSQKEAAAMVPICRKDGHRERSRPATSGNLIAAQRTKALDPMFAADSGSYIRKLTTSVYGEWCRVAAASNLLSYLTKGLDPAEHAIDEKVRSDESCRLVNSDLRTRPGAVRAAVRERRSPCLRLRDSLSAGSRSRRRAVFA